MELRVFQKYIGLINLKHKLVNTIESFENMREDEAIDINSKLLKELSVLSVVRQLIINPMQQLEEFLHCVMQQSGNNFELINEYLAQKAKENTDFENLKLKLEKR